MFTDIGSSGLYVVFQGTSWLYAQQNCRMNNKDLASVRSQVENLALQQIINSAALSSVWIGLFRDDCKWSDQSDSSFRYWASGQPNYDGLCTLYNPSLKGFMDRGCTYSLPFICYEGKNIIPQCIMYLFDFSLFIFIENKCICSL